MLDSSIVNLALPDITRDLGASASESVWVVNAYQLATLTLLLPCAHLGERVGYRRVYLAGLSVFTVELPPLRERRDYIAPLATHFLRRHAGGYV